MAFCLILLIGHQNEQILRKTNFQEIAFHRLVYLYYKLPDFNEIKEISNFFEIRL